MAAARFGGVPHAVVLGLLFMLGMLVTDGINGLWIARLIARADRLERIASRVMSLAIAVVSLLVAAFGAARMALASVDTWSAGRELVFGVAVVAMLGASFLLARALARVARVESGPHQSEKRRAW
jgi:high-affinity nickel-transport protein